MLCSVPWLRGAQASFPSAIGKDAVMPPSSQLLESQNLLICPNRRQLSISTRPSLWDDMQLWKYKVALDPKSGSRGFPLLCFPPDLACCCSARCLSPVGSSPTPALLVSNNMGITSVQNPFWTADRAQCSRIAGLHVWPLHISKGQSSMECKTFFLSSYSLTFPRRSASTKTSHTGLMSAGCSDVQNW